MRAYFKTGDNYYSGFQRFNILADPQFRKCLLAFIPLSAMQIPGVMILAPGQHREILFIAMFLVYMLPAAISIAGGMPAAGWAWYAAAAAFYAAGTIPMALGASPAFLLFLIPALLCFARVDRIAPHLLAALGYKAPPRPAKEIAFTLIATAGLVLYLWLGQALIRKSGVRILPPEWYVWLAATSALYYGTLWGLLYGVLMRRFLDMRYNLVLPIVLNVAIAILYWFPSILGYEIKLEIAIAGSILQGFSSQVALGMTYFFCRSSRPLLAGYVLHYLFLKTLIF